MNGILKLIIIYGPIAFGVLWIMFFVNKPVGKIGVGIYSDDEVTCRYISNFRNDAISCVKK